MKRTKLIPIFLLTLLLSTATSLAQEWTVFELPAKMAEVPAKIEQQFGCTWQELAEQRNITHLKITGMDFTMNYGGTDYEGAKALRQLVVKARELDFSEVTANPDWGIHSKYYDGPDPFVFMDEMGLDDLDSLRRIVFPKTSRTLYGGSLRYCEKLEEVVWPDAPLEMDYYMFEGCKSLKQIDIPGTIVELPSDCFEDCSSLQTVTLHEGLRIIGSQAFRSCNALETITLPNSVETLENDCFLYCKGLKTMSLPQSITSIGYGTFNGCEKLESVTLPNRVKVLGSSMFYNCKALTSIILPDSLETIENDVFSQCTALKSVTLPAGVTTIGSFAFRNTALEEFDMPDAVTSLGEYAFEGCKQLRKVHLSRGLTTIPARCFSDCQVLEEVNIPMRITRIGHDAFVRCYMLPSPQLPEGLTQIDEYAFWNTRFDHITLPSTLQIIGRECFRYSRLCSIDVPANVVEIRSGAFENCDSLRHATLPSGLLYLQSEAFRDCPLLEDVALPAGLRVLGEWVFHGNKSKKTFVQPPLVNVVPNHICCGCENLTSVTLHDRVTRIDGHAFDGCKKLSHINLPEGLHTIGSWAFINCPFTEINIPSTVRIIDERAFNGGQYSRVVVPEGVEFIGERAFYSNNLRYVDLPTTISLLESWAIQGDGSACDSVIIRNPLPPLTWGDQYRSWHGGALYVPAQSVEAYKNDAVFRKGFVNILPLTGYDPMNIVVATTVSTDSTFFPVINNANLTIAHQDWGKDFRSGHLHVGSNVSWPLDHLRYDYRQVWQNSNWENSLSTGTLINEGTMSVQSMEMNLEFPVDQWFFFAVPFDMKVADIVCDDERTPFVLRTFDGAQRAAGNHNQVWTNVDQHATLQAGQGYILQYGAYPYQSGYNSWKSMNADRVFNMKNAQPLHSFALSSQPVTIPLTEYKGEFVHNEGWNMVGNPFMAYFDIEDLECDAPILVANRPWFNGFNVVSPLDDDFRLKPLEAFLVQRSATQTAITFNPAGRQPDFVSHREAVNSARSLRRQALRQGRVVYDATLLRHTEQGDSLLATTRLVVTPRATAGYDRGQDAPFIAIDDSLTALYTRSSGLRYSLNEQPPTTQSVQVGMVIAEAGTYTLAVNLRGDTNAASQHLWLKDKDTGTETDLLTDSYTFTVSEPTTLNNRFLLQLNDGITTVPSVATQSQQAGQTYDLQGRPVSTPTRGLYIQNGKKVIK